MKNSLFKRAFAAAVAVPLALTQCLTVANAVNVNNTNQALSNNMVTADDDTVTINTLTYIEPAADLGLSDGYERVGDTYEKISVWNDTLTTYFEQMTGGETLTDALDATSIYEEAISRAGKYGDIVRSITEKVENLNYVVAANNDITVNGSLNNVAGVFEDMAQDMVASDLKEISEKYNIPELANVKFFEGLEIAGDIKIEINASALKEGTTVKGVVTFTDSVTGKVYKGIEIADYVLEQLDLVEATATASIDDLVGKYTLTDEELERMVQDSDEYKNMIQSLKDGYTPESGEIETMILESLEFKNLVNDYMADNGVDYSAAEAAIKNSDSYQDLLERFTNGINLSDSEIKAILADSPEYEALVNDYVAENNVSVEEATAAVLKSDAYQSLLDEYTDKYTYTDEEIDAMVKGSADYQSKMIEIQDEYNETYDRMLAKANDAKAKIADYSSYFRGKANAALAKYDDLKTVNKTFTGDNYADVATKINNDKKFNAAVDKVTDVADDKVPAYADKIPTSVPTDLDGVSSNQMVQKIFTEIINQISAKSTLSVNMTPEDITALIESATEIEVSKNAGIVTYKCKLPDEDTSSMPKYLEQDAMTYIENTYSVDAIDSYKLADVTVDYTAFDVDGSVTVDLQLKRVVEVTDIDTTTSSSTTTETTVSTDDNTSTTSTETTASTSDGTGSSTSTETTASTSDGTGSSTSTETTASTSDGTGSSTSTKTTASTSDGTGSSTSTKTTASTSDGTGSSTSTETTASTSDGTGSSTSTETTASTSDGTGSSTSTETTASTDEGGTTTLSVSYTVSFDVESTHGFYFSIDKEFNPAQVSSISYVVNAVYTYLDENGETVDEEVVESIANGDITDKFKFNGTPETVYDVDSTTFSYMVSLLATEDIIATDENGNEFVVASADEAITDSEGNEVAVKVYIGVKGDANLDNKADSRDASVVLNWFAEMQTGADASTLVFSTSSLVTGADDILDEFAAFLADVNAEANEDNWKTAKSGRKMDSIDASYIMTVFATVSTGGEPTRELWDSILY